MSVFSILGINWFSLPFGDVARAVILILVPSGAVTIYYGIE